MARLVIVGSARGPEFHNSSQVRGRGRVRAELSMNQESPAPMRRRRRRRIISVALLSLCGALVSIALLLYDYARADVLAGPLPAPHPPPDIIRLTPAEKLGKSMLYDSTLSNPPGYACATCHVAETGYTGPNSEINAFSGPQPGVVPGRFSDRKPQSYLYAAFSPEGPYYDPGLRTWLGGNFWDGRVSDLAKQGLQPPINPNEMANTPEGPYTPANGGYSPLLVQKLADRPYTPLFKQVYGQDAFQKYTPKQLYELFGEALAAYQSSGEVCAFSSKYDASKYGTPPKNSYTLSASEERGRQLYFGQAQCFQCHSSTAVPAIQAITQGKNTFTMYCYANIGVPKNIDNPYYQQTDKETNPHGYNPLGTKYIDYGLGSNPNPAPDGTRFYKNVSGRYPRVPRSVQGAEYARHGQAAVAGLCEGLHAQRGLQEPQRCRPLLQQAKHRRGRQRQGDCFRPAQGPASRLRRAIPGARGPRECPERCGGDASPGDYRDGVERPGRQSPAQFSTGG